MATDKNPRGRRAKNGKTAAAVTKSELVARISADQPELEPRAVEYAVNGILDHLSAALASGERIEIRGFGSLSLRHRPPRAARNPRTGETVHVPAKQLPHFKPGANLRKRVDAAAKQSKGASKKPKRKAGKKSAAKTAKR